MSTNNTEWIGVDLDGTLAHYDKWRGSSHIGEPVPLMVDRVKRWLEGGLQVRIFTARVSPQAIKLNGDTLESTVAPINAWCLKHLGTALPITHEKDMAMVSLWDDRCVRVEINTGKVIGQSYGPRRPDLPR